MTLTKYTTSFSSSLNTSFINEAQLHGVDVLSTDFTDAEAASRTINNWIAAATKNNIQNMFTADELFDQNLLLTNAIYFRGLWRYGFTDTKPGSFRTGQNTRKDVTFMRMEQMLRFNEFQSTDGARGKWVEIPYKVKEGQ